MRISKHPCVPGPAHVGLRPCHLRLLVEELDEHWRWLRPWRAFSHHCCSSNNFSNSSQARELCFLNTSPGALSQGSSAFHHFLKSSQPLELCTYFSKSSRQESCQLSLDILRYCRFHRNIAMLRARTTQEDLEGKVKAWALTIHASETLTQPFCFLHANIQAKRNIQRTHHNMHLSRQSDADSRCVCVLQMIESNCRYL